MCLRTSGGGSFALYCKRLKRLSRKNQTYLGLTLLEVNLCSRPPSKHIDAPAVVELAIKSGIYSGYDTRDTHDVFPLYKVTTVSN